LTEKSLVVIVSNNQ